jgi:hypothetical protein
MKYHHCSDNKWYYKIYCEISVKLTFFVIIAALYLLQNNLPQQENLESEVIGYPLILNLSGQVHTPTVYLHWRKPQYLPHPKPEGLQFLQAVMKSVSEECLLLGRVAVYILQGIKIRERGANLSRWLPNTHAGSSLANFMSWRWRRYVPPKRRFTQYLHDDKSQNKTFFIATAVKTSNLTRMYLSVAKSQTYVIRQIA